MFYPFISANYSFLQNIQSLRQCKKWSVLKEFMLNFLWPKIIQSAFIEREFGPWSILIPNNITNLRLVIASIATATWKFSLTYKQMVFMPLLFIVLICYHFDKVRTAISKSFNTFQVSVQIQKRLVNNNGPKIELCKIPDKRLFISF